MIRMLYVVKKVTMLLNNKKYTTLLDKKSRTTSNITRQQSIIKNSSEDKFETKLFLPEGENRQGEGGRRIQGYLKKSLPDKPLLSVITVVFNGEKYLEETIQSVINQTYDNVEYIIIDGGSNDGTLDIIRKYENVIDYWVSEKDEGIYDAMNKGIYTSKGNFLYFLNCGDYLYTEDVLDYVISKSKGCNFLYGLVKTGNKIEKNDINNKFDLIFSTICHQGVIASRMCFDNNLFSTNLKWLSDYLWIIKCFNNKNIEKKKINKIISYFDPDNNTYLDDFQLKKERLNERFKVGLSEFKGIYKFIFLINQLRLFFKFLVTQCFYHKN